jgi:MYXO-CTERM domain-containing protein
MKRLTVTILALSMALSPAVASACGGFFCSQTPIDQSGERVLFAVDGGTVTAHIQILYQGEAERFAWVLPLPAQPTRIAVGTDMLFQQLSNRTQPRFQVQWLNNNGCYFYGGFDQLGMEDGAGSTGGGGGSNKGVEVLEEDAVGPYDYAVIKGATADSGDEVFQWLADNDYDQPDMAKDIITTYVAEQHVFVAIKLQSQQGSGAIQPLVMDFPFPASCIPLRLTSIAATEDMDVWVYMLGQHRAVPVNYFNVELNPKQINWLQNGNNYSELAGAAVDTAAGRGFLTEFAGDTNDMKGQLWQPGKYDTDKLKKIKTPWDFMIELLAQNFPRTPLVQNILRKHIPKPDSLKELSDQQFYNNLAKYQNELKNQEFDPELLTAEIEEKVLAPMMEANQLFNQHRYMTRMYTRISPNEMTRDPIFLFNPDLPNVSNIHKAIGKPHCKPGTNEVQSVVVTLEDGTEVKYEGPFGWNETPKLVDDGMMGGPAAAVQRMYTIGDPEDVPEDRINEVDNEFDTITVGLAADQTPGGRQTTARPGQTANGGNAAGCTAGSSGPVGGFALMLLLSLGAAVTLRRREDS